MSEQAAIAKVSRPNTRDSLATELRALGLRPGMIVIVHASLSALGWVAGGGATVLRALLDVVTDDGTLVMPAFSTYLTDPAGWSDPPVPEAWWPTVRAAMPAFDTRTTPTWRIGVLPELFRGWPGVRRSDHPTHSFSALGRQAAAITADHGLDFCLGETSPVARLYDRGGQVLLLGVGYDRNTSFHLAEYRMPNRIEGRSATLVMRDGVRVWHDRLGIETNEEIFPAIGGDYETTGQVSIGKVGAADCRLFALAPAVDFALRWLLRQERAATRPAKR